jgi:amidase
MIWPQLSLHPTLASIPFGHVESSGRPYGLHVIVKSHEEGKMINFMSDWESIWPAGKVPQLKAIA